MRDQVVHVPRWGCNYGLSIVEPSDQLDHAARPRRVTRSVSHTRGLLAVVQRAAGDARKTSRGGTGKQRETSCISHSSPLDTCSDNRTWVPPDDRWLRLWSRRSRNAAFTRRGYLAA